MLIENEADQVAELLFDCKPEAYASLFLMAKLQDILLWFDHFTDNGLGQFQFGSKALAQYALRKREEVWDLLVWSSTHAHAPVTVATQPHLFSKLNVEETVRNLARHSRSFWRSREFGDSLKGGQIVAIDRPYFVKELVRLLDKEGKRADAVVRLLSAFIARCSLPDLMQKVLPMLSDEALLSCLCRVLVREDTDLGGGSVFQMGRRALQLAVFSVASFGSADELLLFNALALRSGQVLRTLRQEASQEDLKDISRLLEEMQTRMGHWSNLVLDNSISRTRRMKAMILQLFAARYCLEEAFKECLHMLAACIRMDAWQTL
ncbi:g6373 [Coccomyxa elongata]